MTFEIKSVNKLVIMAVAVLTLLAPKAFSTIVVTSIESRYQYYDKLHHNDYKITWARVPGPRDYERIPSSVTHYGAMEQHDHSSYMCNTTGAGLFPGVQGTMCVDVRGRNMMWREAEELWIKTYGATGPGIVGHESYQPGSRECVMFAGQYGLSAPIDRQYNNGELVCVGAPPTPDPMCYIAPIPDIEFTTSPGPIDLTGQVVGRVLCDIPADVVVMSGTGLSEIDLPWGRARLTLNGASLPLKLHTRPDADFTVQAHVTGAGAEPGVYSGSLILVVGYQ